MTKFVKRSPVPLYVAAAVWLGWSLLFPLYRVLDFAGAVAVSAVAGFLAHKLCPDKTVEIPEPEPEPVKPVSTGDPEIDALVAERDKALSEMRRLNDAIPDEKLSRQIDHLELDTQQIIDCVVKAPEKLPQIRKFMSYYLPTTLKILNTYDRMGDAGGTGDNIAGTMGRIETMMDTIVVAFDKQLDALFADEALDISTDITVMENLLKQEGMSGEKPFQV